MTSLRNNEAEKATLGIALIDRKLLNDVREIINEEDYAVEHADLFIEICKQADNGINYDIITISEALKHHKILNRAYIMSVAQCAPSSINLNYYIDIVKNCSIARKEYIFLEDRKKRLLEGDDPIEVISSGLIADMELIKNDSRDSVKFIKDVINETYEDLETRIDKDFLGIQTGINLWDRLTGGIIEDSLVTIAGRPGTGKTTFAQQIALNISKKEYGMIASLEMSRKRLGIKMFASETGIDSRKFDTPKKLKEHEWVKLATHIGYLSERKLFIDDSTEMKASQIAVRARKIKANYDLKFLIVDYIQIIHPESGKFENRRAEVNTSLRIFKSLARELKISVIILSQILRSSENKKPTLAELKETGALEEMSDIVAFLYKDDESEEKTAKLNNENWFVTPLNIAKNKYGPPDVTSDLIFRRDISKFFDVEKPVIQKSTKQCI